MAHPDELGYAQCEALLRAGVFGRVAVNAADGPHILPVNYSVVDGAIVLRTAPGGLIGTHGPGATVAFEIDLVDHVYQRGWSVLARGPLEVVDDPAMVARVRAVWEPRPWAGGNRSLLLRLRWTQLSGRRLGSGWDPLANLPARRTV